MHVASFSWIDHGLAQKKSQDIHHGAELVWPSRVMVTEVDPAAPELA